MKTRLNWIARFGLGIAATLAAGCAADASGPDEASPSPATATANAGDATRVRAFLDAQYRAADVKHSFRSALGDEIDCVDFDAEPGVRASLARGVSRDDLRRVPEPPADLKARESGQRVEAYFNGEADEAGRERACPAETVPHVRVTSEAIALAGGLDAYQQALHQKAFPSSPSETAPPSPDYAGYAYITSGWSASANQGGSFTTAIASPSVPASTGDHSLSQLWVAGGSGSALQTVELGWNVDPAIYANSTAPHLFIFSTADGYNTTGCYNGSTGSRCLTWIPNAAGATIAIGGALPSSTPGGAQHEITLTAQHVRGFCLGAGCKPVFLGWGLWAQIDGGNTIYLGEYVQGDYGAGALATAAGSFTYGSEVYDQTHAFTNVAMGENGIAFGLGSYGSQAYVRNSSYYDSNYEDVASGAVTGVPTQSVYDVAFIGNAGATSWTNWYYYGDYQKPLIVR